MSTPPEMESVQEGVVPLVRAGDSEALRTALEDLHPSDLADLVASVGEEDRLVIMEALPPEIASETLAEMEEGEGRAELLASMAPSKGAELLHELADDDAADLIAELEPEERALILAALPLDEAGDLRGLLLYDEETAGGIMTTSLVAVRQDLTAGDAIEEVRRLGRDVEDLYTVFVVDERRRLVGTVPLLDLVLAPPGTRVSELAEDVVASVLPDTDQEEVGRLLGRYNMASVPVLNEFGVLLGRVTFDDVIDVMEAEQTEDILLLAGVSDDEELRGGWRGSVRVRLPWLVLNLVTAGIAASVVVLFAETIEQLVILAAIMPIIAGMGGNAGTQALAVTVRRIALSDSVADRKRDVVVKELLVGFANGAALGLIIGTVSYLMGGEPLLGVVVLLAMWGNIILAGVAGSFIPTILDQLNVDPAVASSVFVTTLTDLFGFFMLLGLATWFLL